MRKGEGLCDQQRGVDQDDDCPADLLIFFKLRALVKQRQAKWTEDEEQGEDDDVGIVIPLTGRVYCDTLVIDETGTWCPSAMITIGLPEASSDIWLMMPVTSAPVGPR